MGTTQSKEDKQVFKEFSNTTSVTSLQTESNAEAQSSFAADNDYGGAKHLSRQRTNSDAGSDWSAISALSSSEGRLSSSCWSLPNSCTPAKALDHLGIPANIWTVICSYL